MMLRMPGSNSNAPELLNILGLDDLRAGDRTRIECASRLLSQPIYLGDNVALCRTLGRYKFYVDTRDEGFGSHLLMDGFWEIWLTMFISRMVKPGMRVIDIGANFGYYTVLMADLIGATGRLMAVEPHPETSAFLRRTVRLNGYDDRSVIIEGVVGNDPDTHALLFTPQSEPKNATVVESVAHAGGRAGTFNEVTSYTIDGLVPQIKRVDFIKIDAEGAERDILRGMGQTIEAHDPDVVLEFNAARYADPSEFLDEIMRYWPSLRYIDHHGECLHTNKEAVLTEQFGQDWLLFLSSR